MLVVVDLYEQNRNTENNITFTWHRKHAGNELPVRKYRPMLKGSYEQIRMVPEHPEIL